MWNSGTQEKAVLPVPEFLSSRFNSEQFLACLIRGWSAMGSLSSYIFLFPALRHAYSSGMFTLNAYLEERRQQVEAGLQTHLPPETTRPEILHQAMRYAVLAGGKRLRPILCMAACEAAGGRPENALLPGLAIEILHTYTLAVSYTHLTLPTILRV